MNPRGLLAPALLLATPFLLAQDEPKVPRPPSIGAQIKAAPPAETVPALSAPRNHLGSAARPAVNAAVPAPSRFLSLADTVVFDEAGDGLWCASAAWKAHFDPTGATFVPRLAGAKSNLPVGFHLDAVTIGEAPLPFGDGQVARNGDTVTLERGGLRERYVVSSSGIEQQFVFAALPQRGEIVLDIAVGGEFSVRSGADGFRFEHALGSFGYGKAVALDATGQRLDLVTTWTGTNLRITVPGSFVAGAQLPLVVDPMIGNVITITTSPSPLPATDLAYDASLHAYVVCWEEVYSASDSDVFVRRLDDNLQPVGSVVVIDLTTVAWRACRIAGLNAYDKFLVVAECQDPLVASLKWIGGRVFDGAAAAAVAQFDVAREAVDCAAPDVGGDPSQAVPTYFTVVFERRYSPTDRDIAFRQVLHDATLRGAGGTWIDRSTADEHSPAISKCDGQGAATTQTWAVVYRREGAAGGQTRAGFLSWDGQPRAFGNATNMALGNYAAPAGPVGLDVSSPTDDAYGRFFVVADTVVDGQSQNRILRGTAVDRLGTLLATGDLSMPNNADTEPSIDCDGRRFAMAWTDGAGNGDIAFASYERIGTQIVRPEAIFVGQAGEVNHSPALVAMHSGGASAASDRLCGAVWADDLSAGNRISARRYQIERDSGISYRNTGCGSIGWYASGHAAIGEAVTAQLALPVGFSGWVFGTPVTVPLGFCPGCTQGSSADVIVTNPTLVVLIPAVPSFVGVTVSLQGFDFAAGSCLGSIALSDTLDLTIFQ